MQIQNKQALKKPTCWVGFALENIKSCQGFRKTLQGVVEKQAQKKDA